MHPLSISELAKERVIMQKIVYLLFAIIFTDLLGYGLIHLHTQVSQHFMEIYVGDTLDFRGSGLSDLTPVDNDIARVDNGVIVGISAGETIIRYSFRGKHYNLPVTVKKNYLIIIYQFWFFGSLVFFFIYLMNSLRRRKLNHDCISFRIREPEYSIYSKSA